MRAFVNVCMASSKIAMARLQSQSGVLFTARLRYHPPGLESWHKDDAIV